MAWIYGIDVWEGSLDIDEQELRAGGVSFIIPRLNSISGGLRLDTNFRTQWEQAAPFVRFPYYVYWPWTSGRANFDFMRAHLPPGVKRIAIDIEIARAGYSPTEYATNVQLFVNLCITNGLWPIIYTGAWFMPVLSQWPKCEYWWARYPYTMYPPQSMRISWAELRARLDTLTWNPNCTLGPCRLWQCSGDRFKLPGCRDRVVDINIWNGTLDEMREWVGEMPAGLSDSEKLARLWAAHPELH